MSRLAKALFAAAGLVFVVTLSVILIGGRNVVEAARDNRPNIVVVMTDDQYNTTLKDMPYVQSRNDWARFSNAIVGTALCAPSRSTFLSGQTSTHTGVDRNSTTTLFKGRSTVADWLGDSGYTTAYVGKYLNKFPWDEKDTYVPHGWDYWAGYSGPERYFDFTLNQNGTLVDYAGPNHYSTDVLSDQASSFINDVNTNKPFFEFVAYNSPHSPWTPPKRYADAQVRKLAKTKAFLERNVKDKPKWIRGLHPPPRKKLIEDRIKHNQALLAIDDGVEQIFQSLKDRGLLDNTIVVFTTDHGIAIGEHNYNHKNCSYDICVRVPLLVRGPGVDPGTVRGLVGNTDFAPTIADWADIRTGRAVDGRSFQPLLDGRKAKLHKGVLLRRAHGQGERIYWGVRTSRWKYVEYSRTGEKELYDLKHDPDEVKNLMAGKHKQRYKKKAAALHRRIETMRKTKPKVRR